jgi:hypothetical protein
MDAANLNAATYLAVLAVSEAAFSPDDQLPRLYREFADMTEKIGTDQDARTGIVNTLGTLLYWAKMSLLALPGIPYARLDPHAFIRAVGRAPAVSADANKVMAMMAEDADQSGFMRKVVTCLRDDRTVATEAAFEVLAVLLRMIIERHGEGNAWQRWHVTAQVLGVALPIYSATD